MGPKESVAILILSAYVFDEIKSKDANIDRINFLIPFISPPNCEDIIPYFFDYKKLN